MQILFWNSILITLQPQSVLWYLFCHNTHCSEAILPDHASGLRGSTHDTRIWLVFRQRKRENYTCTCKLFQTLIEWQYKPVQTITNMRNHAMWFITVSPLFLYKYILLHKKLIASDTRELSKHISPHWLKVSIRYTHGRVTITPVS